MSSSRLPAVSLDYIAKPDFYRGEVPDSIVDLACSYGYARNFPDKHQRSRLILPHLRLLRRIPPAKRGDGNNQQVPSVPGTAV
jgi:hypothetical protein